MDLNEFRAALSCAASEENKKLKEENARLKKEYECLREETNEVRKRLLDDCRALSNRCFTHTNGVMCMFCELNEYQCEHSLPLNEKLKMAKKLRDTLAE